MKRLLMILALACAAQAQVVLSPIPRYHSWMQNGSPNAFGCVFTYQSNTTIPLATYTDNTGVTLNPNPVPLNAGGAASIWLQPGQIYTLVEKTSGGTNCASGSTISTTNGMNQTLLNLANTWQQTQTFVDPIDLLASDLQIVFGSPSGTQTTLDIPPTSGNVILHGPPLTATDTLVSQNATQTVTNKNLTTGTQVNGCGMTNGPATYLCIANNGLSATVLNSLAVLTGAPSTATVAPITATAGVVGIVTANAGITGSAVIQQNGVVSCNYDGRTFAGDIVVISSSVAGDCHDSGSSIGPSGIGIVLASAFSGGLISTVLTPTSQACNLSQNNCQFDVTGATGGAGSNFLAPVAGMYRVGCYVILTQVATSSSTLPSCAIQWTDRDSGVAQNFTLTATATTNDLFTFKQGFMVVDTQAATNIVWSTTGYASSGATPMQYAVHVTAYPF